MLIVELEKKKDKEVLEKGEKIERLWRVGVDEDLTMEEIKRRRMARRERARGKKVEMSKELRMKSRRWTWNEERWSWEEVDEEEESWGAGRVWRNREMGKRGRREWREKEERRITRLACREER